MKRRHQVDDATRLRSTLVARLSRSPASPPRLQLLGERRAVDGVRAIRLQPQIVSVVVVVKPELTIKTYFWLIMSL